jgi:hypothetical protein
MNPDVFHAHLDVCRQCREHPFALCVEGEKAVRSAMLDDAVKVMKKHYGTPPKKGETRGASG